MGKVIAQASISLDGFIADTDDHAGPLFERMVPAVVSAGGLSPRRGSGPRTWRPRSNGTVSPRPSR
jgi:hypothetical protein